MDSIATLAPFTLFAISATFTPGPNNVMLMASGANYGFRATLPHMAGITVGIIFMVIAIGLGLGTLFERAPMLHQALRWIGSAYLIWLAWRIATAAGVGTAGRSGRPLSFLQAAGFQWVNPKAWMMIVSAFAVYSTAYAASPAMQAAIFGLIVGIISIPSVAVWTLFGTAIGRILKSARALRLFNGAMAALLVASVALLFV